MLLELRAFSADKTKIPAPKCWVDPEDVSGIMAVPMSEQRQLPTGQIVNSIIGEAYQVILKGGGAVLVQFGTNPTTHYLQPLLDAIAALRGHPVRFADSVGADAVDTLRDNHKLLVMT